jgi:hypothetical protein
MTAIIRPWPGPLNNPTLFLSQFLMLIGLNLLSLSAFATTDIEERDIAAAASIGIAASYQDQCPIGRGAAVTEMRTALFIRADVT